MLATTTESKSSGADRSDFFCPIDKILGSFFFFVFSGEAAKAKGGGAIATNEGQKAEYYAEATADVLRWSGKYAAAEKKVGVFVLLSLLFWPLHMNNDLFQAIEGLFRRSGGAGWQEGFND